MNKTIKLFLFCFPFLLLSCQEKPKEHLLLTSDRPAQKYVSKDSTPELVNKKSYYIPAYSNLYYQTGASKVYFTVVLSLRNTSSHENIYFTKIDYYNSDGELIRAYLEENLLIKPLGSAEFIVEFKERESGAGANFIVEYGTEKELINKPIIEAINMGYIGQQGFAFTSSAQLLK
ncbi:DUF3124 domain-containing protein [Flammeovirga sp. SubArs3]|uniref:DUF3124 domain-containing protein n=1 Tax=Flammeovirga sp. SubArs3 TaxID=2995316 RepID=UPI00248AE79F|nr:DUF3124 domain-containing protein [Flammeovirga sp. SubArs3]